MAVWDICRTIWLIQHQAKLSGIYDPISYGWLLDEDFIFPMAISQSEHDKYPLGRIKTVMTQWPIVADV